MEAKDTVMNEKDIIKYSGVTAFPSGTVQAQLVLEAQAKISFKAGYKYALEGTVMGGAYESIKKVGIREVVEWIELDKFNADGFPCYNAQSWQAKLKEWGIKDG